MKVLVIDHLTGKDIRPHLQGEGRRVAELRSEGLIQDLFSRADRTGFSRPTVPGRSWVLIDINANDLGQRDRLASLPFVEYELVTFDYIELDDNSPA
jgi:hypothetical protein